MVSLLPGMDHIWYINVEKTPDQFPLLKQLNVLLRTVQAWGSIDEIIENKSHGRKINLIMGVI